MDSSSVTATMVASDPVSLRAAALSTRKSKRRKPPLEQSVTLSLRPTPSNDSFQLDYGQEDPTDTVSKPTIMPSAPDVVVKREKTPVVLQDVQLREEGEISDEEGPPPPSISSKDHIRKPPEPPVFAVHEPKVEEPTPTISVAPVSLPKSSSPQIPQTLPLMDRISDPVADMPTHLLQLDQDQDQDMDVPVLDLLEEPPNYVLGPDCVRPGVELSQDEYDTAKDIILDLLGWGVPFDHLVQSGVSKRLIFYVFNELNLCLPDTFDSSGIAPYPPEVFPELDQSVAIGPPLPEGRAMSTDSDEPVGMDAISNSVPPPIETTPSVDVPTEADLHDMERLRRQELMARKAAAQASRKQKQSASLESLIQPSIPTDSMVVDQDTEAPPYAATETVEDFLNSLGTVQGLDTSPTSVFSPTVPESRTYSHDQPINNDVVDMDDHEEEGPLNTAVSESFSISSRQSQTFGPPPPSSSSEAPPSSVASTTSTFSQVSLSGPETTQRRGVKRPVASDFVDFDPLPKRHETSRMDRFNGTGGITRRLNSRMSFQNINSRRCVIDLSDSEDEDDEQQPHRMNDEPSQQWPDKRAHLTRFPPAPVKSTSSGTISPAILEQKELEIRQMRELIAKREEETRLRKLALANSASVNSGQHGASTSVVQPKHVKVKEADSGIVSTETDDMDAQVPESSLQSESGTPHSATAESREYSSTPEVPGIPSDIPEPQADSHISNDERHGLQEQVIDVDLNASPSAQMNTEPMPSAFPGQDIQNQEDSQPLDHDHLQVQDNDQDTFSSYRSPFDLYPLLRSHGQPVASSSDMYSSRPLLSSHLNFVDTKTLGSSTFSSSSLLLDLKPLRLAALAKSLDPFKRLCQFEVPGGGTCRDEGCEDIHLSRLVDANQTVALEPNDEDTANYLFDNLPPSWLDGHHIASPSKILAALQDINRKNLNNPSRLEDRVSQALHSLGSAPTT